MKPDHITGPMDKLYRIKPLVWERHKGINPRPYDIIVTCTIISEK
jgi:hypothetical protein